MLDLKPSNAGLFPAAIADAVREAVEATFDRICSEKPILRTNGDQDIAGSSVIGIISFVGDHTWSLALVLPQETAPALARQFAGFDVPFDSADMGDVVGELANVLAGDVVARLEGKRITAHMTLPTVARGQDMKTILSKGTAAMHMTFASGQGPLRFNLAAVQSECPIGRRSGA